MPRAARRSRTLAVLLAATLALAACAATDEATDDMAAMGDEAMGDMGDMVMDEPDAPRADEVDADEVRTAPFVRFADAPAAFADATGTATVALDPELGTTVTLDLEGLPTGTEVVSHLHAQPCAARGGPHFKFDRSGGDTPPNEVHLAGTPADDGTLTLNVTNEQAAQDAMAVVFHPRADTDQYVACADVPPSG